MASCGSIPAPTRFRRRIANAYAASYFCPLIAGKVAFACKLALKAGTRLFNAAGGRAFYQGNGIERQYRNLLGAVSHHGVQWDVAASGYGEMLLARHGG